MRGRRIGALIGSIGGLAFVLVNAGRLPGTVALVVRVVGVAAFLTALWLAMRRRGTDEASPPPSRAAMRVYWICVGAEVVSIPLGAAVINQVLHRPALTVVWVVFVAGVHFLPFARAFEAPAFIWVAWTLILLAAAGAIAGVLSGARATASIAVLAGLALLGYSLAGLLGWPRRSAEPVTDAR